MGFPLSPLHATLVIFGCEEAAVLLYERRLFCEGCKLVRGVGRGQRRMGSTPISPETGNACHFTWVFLMPLSAGSALLCQETLAARQRPDRSVGLGPLKQCVRCMSMCIQYSKNNRSQPYFVNCTLGQESCVVSDPVCFSPYSESFIKTLTVSL